MLTTRKSGSREGNSSRVEIYDSIKKGHSAFVEDSADGSEVEVITAISSKGTKYVKTEANDTKRDNLLNLPKCN